MPHVTRDFYLQHTVAFWVVRFDVDNWGALEGVQANNCEFASIYPFNLNDRYSYRIRSRRAPAREDSGKRCPLVSGRSDLECLPVFRVIAQVKPIEHDQMGVSLDSEKGWRELGFYLNN